MEKLTGLGGGGGGRGWETREGDIGEMTTTEGERGEVGCKIE